MPKILLVDDDEMSRDMLSRRLIRRGFEVIIAVDGKQGVDTARREKPDIILPHRAIEWVISNRF
jgi:DNA-binding response OmpR family regulator